MNDTGMMLVRVILLVPACSAALLAWLPDDRLTARLNALGTLFTFLASTGLFFARPEPGAFLIVDDVMTAGTAVRESVAIIRAAGAQPAGVAVCLDRMERGTGNLSAVQEVGANYNVPVFSIATLDDLMAYLRAEPQHARNLAAVGRYRDQYGVTAHA